MSLHTDYMCGSQVGNFALGLDRYGNVYSGGCCILADQKNLNCSLDSNYPEDVIVNGEHFKKSELRSLDHNLVEPMLITVPSDSKYNANKIMQNVGIILMIGGAILFTIDVIKSLKK